MKIKELRELTSEVLNDKIKGWKEELFNLRFQAKLGQLSNALQFRMIRRDIARAETLINEKARDVSVKKV